MGFRLFCSSEYDVERPQVAVAERLCRASNRFGPAGMYRPCDRAKPAAPAKSSQGVLSVLPQFSDSSRIGEGQSEAAAS